MKEVFGIGIFLVCTLVSTAQHAPTLSQYMINGIAINPAFAGSDNVMSVLLSTRRQWAGIPGAPSTHTLSAHGPLSNERFGVGAMLFQDVVGPTKSSGVSSNMSYYVPLPTGRIYMGLSTGLFFIRKNITQLASTENGDPTLASNPPLGVLPQVGTGFLYDSDDFFLSLSIPFLLTHSISDHGDKFSVSHDMGNYNVFAGGGMRFSLGTKLHLLPSLLLKSHTSSGSQVDLNMLVDINNKLEVGCSIRLQDAVLGIIKFHINDQFDASYSYDYTLSELQNFNSGSHEISLTYSLRYNTTAIGPRALSW